MLAKTDYFNFTSNNNKNRDLLIPFFIGASSSYLMYDRTNLQHLRLFDTKLNEFQWKTKTNFNSLFNSNT